MIDLIGSRPSTEAHLHLQDCLSSFLLPRGLVWRVWEVQRRGWAGRHLLENPLSSRRRGRFSAIYRIWNWCQWQLVEQRSLQRTFFARLHHLPNVHPTPSLKGVWIVWEIRWEIFSTPFRWSALKRIIHRLIVTCIIHHTLFMSVHMTLLKIWEFLIFHILHNA